MLFFIALGGAAGTLARYGIGGVVHRHGASFPYGTLIVNVLGSFLIGFLMRSLFGSTASPELRAALTIGFCGGFTTFSTFSYEALMLLETGSYARATTYVVGSVFLSLAATFAGLGAARLMTGHAT